MHHHYARNSRVHSFQRESLLLGVQGNSFVVTRSRIPTNDDITEGLFEAIERRLFVRAQTIRVPYCWTGGAQKSIASPNR